MEKTAKGFPHVIKKKSPKKKRGDKNRGREKAKERVCGTMDGKGQERKERSRRGMKSKWFA